MSGRPGGERGPCWLGRLAQRAGCLPDKSTTNVQVHYPICRTSPPSCHTSSFKSFLALRPADNGYGHNYSDDIKFKPGPRFPPPQPGEPEPQTNTYVAAYQPRLLQAPEIPKKTPVVQTVPLSTLPLPSKHPVSVVCWTLKPTTSAVNTFPGYTPATPCVTLRAEPPVIPPVHIGPTPRAPPLSAIPQTPYQNIVPNSIFQDLGNITPTQYIWNTPHGSLVYTPAPASAPLPPNPLPNTGVYPSRIVDLGDGNDESIGLGLIPSPISSDTSDLSADRTIFDRCSGITLNPLLAPNHRLPQETQVEWDVSEPVDRARHVLDDARFVASANEPATNPPTNNLRIEFHFIDNPGTKWNWEPITIRKPRSIRITDVFHAIHDYFQTQLTHAEYDVIKSHGKSNARIVRDSWNGRVNSQPEGGARSSVYYGGPRRVDCLGSSKKFAGLWVDGSLLKLGLRS